MPYLGPGSLGHDETEAEPRRTVESGERITIELDAAAPAFLASPTPQRPVSPPSSPASPSAKPPSYREQERPFLRRGLLITASLGIAVTGAALALAMTRPGDKPAGLPTTQTQPVELLPGSKEQADNRTETMIEDAREQAKSLRSQDRRSQAAIPAGAPGAPRAVPDPPLSAPPATRAEPAPDPGAPPGADTEENGSGAGEDKPPFAVE